MSLETVWKILETLGLVDLAKKFVATSAPAKHGRRAAQILSLMPQAWTEAKVAAAASPDDFKDSEDYQIAAGAALGALYYSRTHMLDINLNDTRIAWAWVESQLALEKTAWS